ncbi:hypothetical protein ACFFX1_55450 [Dactylosporangium sucinum]|uniref:Uncharacterized protein n=1 Tax=Dactylosporangium sucinum TaxID=1424081 RepID=A0A917U264_9ACTN|nr:hypothetical protein [Dactylosporangium sucinum]GGM52616.1 hypothetical protein GCM10007977_062740 [Dactylosporangium sucinum]
MTVMPRADRVRAEIDRVESLANVAVEVFLNGEPTGMEGLHPHVAYYLHNLAPGRLFRLIAAHRVVLNRHRVEDSPARGEHRVCACCRALWPCPDVSGVAEFWLWGES